MKHQNDPFKRQFLKRKAAISITTNANKCNSEARELTSLVRSEASSTGARAVQRRVALSSILNGTDHMGVENLRSIILQSQTTPY